MVLLAAILAVLTMAASLDRRRTAIHLALGVLVGLVLGWMSMRRLQDAVTEQVVSADGRQAIQALLAEVASSFRTAVLVIGVVAIVVAVAAHLAGRPRGWPPCRNFEGEAGRVTQRHPPRAHAVVQPNVGPRLATVAGGTMTDRAEEPPDQPSPPDDDGTDDVIERLSRLAKLRDTGVLTEEEFQAEKARILGSRRLSRPDLSPAEGEAVRRDHPGL